MSRLTFKKAQKIMQATGGSLDLRDMGITELPADLHVGWYLDLEYTGITELPAGLHVGGSLYLRGTGITELPAGLHVGGSLDLEYTQIPVIYDDIERGYKLRAVRCGEDVWYVGGCRLFTSKAKALAHWGGDKYPDKDRGQAFCDAINGVAI